jgi:16S rRNA (adenine1518-N6/adenine1519-N6)-dimethyltransferase
MSSPQDILKKYQISPSRGLGQNFLADKFALKKLILAAEFEPTDVVLEIGPGIGNLTKELAKKAGKVIAVEKDKRMVGILKETLKGFDNIEVIQEDILKLNPTPYTLSPYKVVANLPFYLTAPVIRKFLESKLQPELMVFIVQKEVAQRIAAKPPKMNLLAVSAQFYAKPKIITYVSKKSFWPRPKVDSAIIEISNIKNQKSKIDTSLFFRVARSGFSQPRKQLVNNLSKKLQLDKDKARGWLLKNKIRPEQRAQNLTVEDWINLAKTFDDK